MEWEKFEVLGQEEQFNTYGGEQKGITLFDSVKDFLTKLFGIETSNNVN